MHSAHTFSAATAGRPIGTVLCCDKKMADEGGSLFCDEDETCEKNVSESDEDTEEYVSAPIGENAIVFYRRFNTLSHVFKQIGVLFSHPYLPRVVVHFYRLFAGFGLLNVRSLIQSLNFNFFCIPDKLGPFGRWLRHRLLSSILIGTPPLVALQVKS